MISIREDYSSLMDFSFFSFFITCPRPSDKYLLSCFQYFGAVLTFVRSWPYPKYRKSVSLYFFHRLLYPSTLQYFTLCSQSESWRDPPRIIRIVVAAIAISGHVPEANRIIGGGRAQPPKIISSISLFTSS